ncbi:MAG: hypothetical protein ACRDH5_08650 [bacterium]
MRRHPWATTAIAFLLATGAAATSAGLAQAPAGRSPCEQLGDGLQDDAGSGGDAGDSVEEATPIQKHETYEGTLPPIALQGIYEDRADLFAFSSPAQESVRATVTSSGNPRIQVLLTSPSGQVFVAQTGQGQSAFFGQLFQIEVPGEEGTWTLSLLGQPLTLPGLGCPLAPVTGSFVSAPKSYAIVVDGCEPFCGAAA